jgi:hypothetical protein
MATHHQCTVKLLMCSNLHCAYSNKLIVNWIIVKISNTASATQGIPLPLVRQMDVHPMKNKNMEAAIQQLPVGI